MYSLIPTVLLILPSLSFAIPAQSIETLQLLAPNSNTSYNIGAAPVDPQFAVVPHFEDTQIDEDQFLVAAVQVMAALAEEPSQQRMRSRGFWDPQFPNVRIDLRTMSPDRTTEVRFLMWGLYLGVKSMLEGDHFQVVHILLLWKGEQVGWVSIEKGRGPRLLSGGGGESFNSSEILQQRSLSDQANVPTSGSQDSDSFTLTASDTPANPNNLEQLVIASLGRDLPKHAIVIAILDSMLAVASTNPGEKLVDPVRIRPAAPYNVVELKMQPVEPPPGKPYMTPILYTSLIKDLPFLFVTRERRWREVEFKYLVNELVVGTGSLMRA